MLRSEYSAIARIAGSRGVDLRELRLAEAAGGATLHSAATRSGFGLISSSSDEFRRVSQSVLATTDEPEVNRCR